MKNLYAFTEIEYTAQPGYVSLNVNEADELRLSVRTSGFGGHTSTMTLTPEMAQQLAQALVRSQSAAVVVGGGVSPWTVVAGLRADAAAAEQVDHRLAQMFGNHANALESALRAQPGGEGMDMRDDWISAATIDQYIEDLADEYEFRGDDGDYTPNEQERLLLIDFAHGFMADAMLLAMLRSHFDPNTRGYQKPRSPAPSASGVDVASGMGKGGGE